MKKPTSCKGLSKKIAINSTSAYRRWVAAALVTGGMFQLAAPVLADGTAAGTTISNTATGTYDDGNGSTIQTVSNTVEITVAEVAGVTVSNAGVDNVTSSGAVLQAGNTADFKFNVTNVGNDPTKFFLPSASILNGASAVLNGTATSISYQLLDANGTGTGAVTNVTGNGLQTVSVPASSQIRVTVRVTIDTNATGSVSVTLGNTTPVGTQNVARTANANDVYTVDNADADGVANEQAGVPVNGVREASSQQTASFSAGIQPFALLTKTHGVSSAGNPVGPEGDTLPYTLNFNVLNSLPASGVPANVTGTDDLHPTFVPGLSTPGNATTNRVLVSDVIPTDTVLNAVPTGLPTGWIAVYSTDDPSSTNSSYEASWAVLDNTVNLTTVKRIGFVYRAGQVVNKGTTATFRFTVKFTANVDQGDKIENIAQVFGEKAGVTPTAATVPGIYDESGDQSANNDSDGDGVVDYTADTTTGLGNSTTQGEDTDNNNTGTGTGGEANVFTVATTTTAGILNGTVIASGPNAGLHPDAVGPTSNNDDFTNGASVVTTGPATVPLVAFTNSVQNTSNVTANLSLIPLAANLTDLPVGTTIITVEATGLTTVTYTVVQAALNGTPTVTPSSTTPLTFANIAPNEIKQYAVTVDLPDNATQNQGYDVPITAFIDGDASNAPNGSEAQNITIDRVYAGFINLLKESRIMRNETTPVSGTRGQFSTATKAVEPGEFVEYRVTYQNISSPQVGQFNVILNGKNLKITEDGTTGGNDWALDTNNDGVINTTHVQATAASNGGVLQYFNGVLSLGNSDPATDTLVTKYTNTLPTAFSLLPQQTGTFSFQRKLNN
ncbi:MAG: hypothetical protein KME08_07930 [Aphanothece sp. CMT-3BRIN-NPC111]|nr:hypothetical protein [Aphanothece sp. CMT-3BRIN-NPC111]